MSFKNGITSLKNRFSSALWTIIKGIIILAVAVAIGNFFIKSGWGTLWKIIKFLQEIIVSCIQFDAVIKSPDMQGWVSLGISIVFLILIAWLGGKIHPSRMIFFLRKRRGLFCVRRKATAFPGRYTVGIVMNAYEEKGKKYCNVLFPNVAGLITNFGVPEEELERVNVKPEDLMAASAFMGAMKLENLH